MNYLTEICKHKKQIFFCMFSFLIGSCSVVSTSKSRIPTKSVQAIPEWFKVEERFASRGLQGEIPAHPFYDLVPFGSKKDNSINFFPITAAGSPSAYDFSLPTGKRFKKYDYCAHKDVWKNFIWYLNKPPYTEGVVPRLIDQRGRPQKILVFGGDHYFAQELKNRVVKSYRARVVGGVIEQFCDDYPCTEKGTWLSRLVLIAVDPGDPKFGWVSSLMDLKNAVNWTYVKAYMENSQGHNVTARGDMPAYRIFGALKPDVALDTALKKGKLFDYGSMVKMRASCHKLYDYIWEQTQRIRDKKNKRSFARFFGRFYSKYGQRYNTCAKFVRPSSINSNIERHWLFVYITSFMKMNQLGYVYSCRSRTWHINALTLSGKYKFSPEKEYRKCVTRDLNYAFDLAATTLTGLRQSHQKHFYYMEYDDVEHGSHERIHFWVDVSGKKLSCNETAGHVIMPPDLSWKRF